MWLGGWLVNSPRDLNNLCRAKLTEVHCSANSLLRTMDSATDGLLFSVFKKKGT